MSHWRIDVAVARGVLDSAETDTAAFDTSVTDIGTALDGAIAATGGGASSAALARLAVDPFAVDIATARGRAANAIAGVRQAIAFYEAGDEEMAADTQRAMRQI